MQIQFSQNEVLYGNDRKFQNTDVAPILEIYHTDVAPVLEIQHTDVAPIVEDHRASIDDLGETQLTDVAQVVEVIHLNLNLTIQTTYWF